MVDNEQKPSDASEGSDRTLASRTAREVNVEEMCDIAGGGCCTTSLPISGGCDDVANH